MSIRISCTELEAYRYYKNNEDASLESLLAQLRKETPPTSAMQAGSAWHKALETMDRAKAADAETISVAETECPSCLGHGVYETGDLPDPGRPCDRCDGSGVQEGFTFRIVGDIELSLPEITELKGELELQTRSGPVTLVGVVDGIDAGGVRDYKLSGRFDAERYLDSLQWRCYLLMFGVKRFVYEVFTAREDERSGEWLVTAYDRLPFYAYPGLEADVQRAVEDFAAFLTVYLPERVQQVALA